MTLKMTMGMMMTRVQEAQSASCPLHLGDLEKNIARN